jgi:hypothetical protein
METWRRRFAADDGAAGGRSDCGCEAAHGVAEGGAVVVRGVVVWVDDMVGELGQRRSE